MSTAPVVRLSATRLVRATPFTVVNWPPAYTAVLLTARAVARALALAVNAVTGAPVAGLRRAIFRRVTPLIVLNVPAT